MGRLRRCAARADPKLSASPFARACAQCASVRSPATPCLRTSSAYSNAWLMGRSAFALASSLSLETTMSASVASRIAWIASTACRIRRAPSKRNGFVTTPTVRQPATLAHSATTGAAPEPVPPPMPATTKTRSAPRTIALISATLSSAANRPIAGSPPAPSPRVTSRPICTCLEPRADASSACASVLMQKHSTPAWPMRIIRVIALLPPPPTPRTRITHGLPPGTLDMATRAPLRTAAAGYGRAVAPAGSPVAPPKPPAPARQSTARRVAPMACLGVLFKTDPRSGSHNSWRWSRAASDARGKFSGRCCD